MKVSEAEKLVCPFITEMGEDGSGFTVFSKSIKCITTKCMAWKVAKEWEYREGHKYRPLKEIGYCQRIGQ